VALGLPGIALAILVRLTLTEPVRGMVDGAQSKEPDPSIARTIGRLWRCRTYRLLVLYAVASGFFQFGISQWSPSFYMRVFRFDMASAGIYLGAAIGIGSGFGMLIGGWLSNAFSVRDVRLPLAIGSAAVLLALPIVLAALFASSAFGSLGLVSLMWVLWSVPTGAVVASAYSVLPPEMRATGGAVSVFLSSVLGFGLGPYCVGALSDVLTPAYGVQALRYSLLVPTCALPLMSILLCAAARRLPSDLVGERRPIQGEQ
jgi:MFS family permease